MPKFTYSAMSRIPESERVRIGYRDADLLEQHGCRTCGQKLAMTTVPFLAAFVHLKEFQLKYGHYPLLRASGLLLYMTPRQVVHFCLPIGLFLTGLWFCELTYNRCVLGVQGALPLPDQVIKRGSYP